MRVDVAKESNWSHDQREIAELAIRAYFQMLECTPLLMIGIHEPTGGLMVTPVWDKKADDQDVLEVLDRVRDYLIRSIEAK